MVHGVLSLVLVLNTASSLVRSRTDCPMVLAVILLASVSVRSADWG